MISLGCNELLLSDSRVFFILEPPKDGIKKILVISPGFSSDCVETLEEISIQGKESFKKFGGEKFEFIPCLNDNDDHITLLEYLVRKNIS